MAGSGFDPSMLEGLGGERPKTETPDEKRKREAREKIDKDNSFTINSRNLEERYGNDRTQWKYWRATNEPVDQKELADSLTITSDPPVMAKNDIQRERRYLNPDNSGRDVYIDKNGKISPVPFSWESKDVYGKSMDDIYEEQKNAYRGAWSFLMATQGALSVEIDFPHNKLTSMQKERMLKMQFELARENNSTLEFGPNIKAYLNSLKREDYERWEQQRTELLQNKLVNTNKFKASRAERLDSMEKELQGKITPNADLTAYNAVPAGPRDSFEKAKIIEKELLKLQEKVGELDNDDKRAKTEKETTFGRAIDKLGSVLDAYGSMLNEPEKQLAYAKPKEKLSRTERFTSWAAEQLGYKKNDIVDTEALVDHVRDLNSKTYDSREKLIRTLETEITNTKRHLADWEVQGRGLRFPLGSAIDLDTRIVNLNTTKAADEAASQGAPARSETKAAKERLEELKTLENIKTTYDKTKADLTKREAQLAQLKAFHQKLPKADPNDATKPDFIRDAKEREKTNMAAKRR